LGIKKEMIGYNIKEFIKKNKFLILIFSLLTLFLLVQHFLYLSWDFSAYVLNAKYLFGRGDYYEVYRAPGISILLGIFIIFGKLGEYLAVFCISILFLISTVYLSDALYEKYWHQYQLSKEKTRLIFALFSLNPFLIYHGTMVGTELLAFAFLELFIGAVIKQKANGHFLGLGVLSRYNLLIFGFFLLFNKKIKKIFLNIVLFIAILAPWLIYNKYKWGNFFASIIDSYSLNVASRTGSFESFKLTDPIIAVNIFIPFLILGLVIFFMSAHKKIKGKEVEKGIFFTGLIFLIIGTFIIYDYSTTPFKITRYLFNLALPVAFFSTLGALHLLSKKEEYLKIFVLALSILFFASIAIHFANSYDKRFAGDIYKEAAKGIEDLGIKDCVVKSSLWVPVNYYTNNVYYLVDLNKTLDSKSYALIFPCCPTVDDTFSLKDIDSYPVVLKKDNFIILAKPETNNETCKKREGWDRPIVTDQCQFIKERFGNLAGKTCLLIT
jgi:hypothetical protein